MQHFNGFFCIYLFANLQESASISCDEKQTCRSMYCFQYYSPHAHICPYSTTDFVFRFSARTSIFAPTLAHSTPSLPLRPSHFLFSHTHVVSCSYSPLERAASTFGENALSFSRAPLISCDHVFEKFASARKTVSVRFEFPAWAAWKYDKVTFS